MDNIVPADSRYIPFTQQQYCCVPTCFQMVMYRHGIPLKPAEEIGYYLGLVVPPSVKHLFHNVRVSDNKPPAGYGTRIYEPEFEPNMAFKKMGLPLVFRKRLIGEFKTPQELLQYLKTAEAGDRDILVCYNYGVLTGDASIDCGHVCVFDRVLESGVRILDPLYEQPKWRTVEVGKLFDAMVKHGEQRSAGCWEISLTNPSTESGY